ncbi:hypothetical protein P3633_22185 [Vibrio parahaemolyticus]|nr:hypothetical protein [Vibrio parahaemolyticus]MDF5316541.1 hypothetical protein [Vibrio parahaemolyticus]MDF5340918.1 hypothetical protein [Vibrio parahaemolyticus]MDF5350889.1 hypothetical protein [Vibrio parahaemolyticus]MDF5462101.1 hypothetical protein [Vibrio parahaemolyticus]
MIKAVCGSISIASLTP